MSATTALKWFKSSYSGGDGDACLEVALSWRKSSYSGSEGGACLEVATGPDTVHVRDSKVQDGPVLTLAPASWAALTGWLAR
ncbi:DUF397 domain-containing protein [Streptomyces sp. NRRL F-4428]|uniref:DUF397 domain-containing protein n=1 Tax=Streptomyces sp. NRRL F-4428 TaxID=1609137 RepID=UPI0004AB1EF4|nr:DUF397 domain-containing protein [Streptomyces sp. NRRL F-4428]KJK53182.1 toxin [Streptomyces sp. NRRL F-4428]